MNKKLSQYQLQELQDWLNKFSLSKIIIANKFHRDLSDGVIVAMILKQLHPKIVDLHNYSTSSSIKLKRVNWDTLNNKVLKKLGIQQSINTLDLISKSTPGYIEKLLFKIMRNEALVQKSKCETQSQEDDTTYAMNDEIIMVNVNKQIGDAIIQVPQKMILYSIFEETLNDLKERKIKIEMFYQKIAHLENLIELKNERIEELTGQIDKLKVRSKQLSQESLDILAPSSTLLNTEYSI